MEVLHEAPAASSFVTLAEHQSSTPASFYSGPPILHHLSERCKVVILERDLTSTPALNSLRSSQSAGASTNGSSAAPASEEAEDKETTIEGVNVWVSSKKLLLYSPPAAAGVAIPYPSISLHAIQRLRLPDTTSTSPENDTVQGLYMQLASSSGDGGDEYEESITLTIVPDTQAPAQWRSTAQPENDLLVDDGPSQTPTEALFAAVSACSNLHPDPVEGDEDEDMGEGGGPQIEGSALFQNGLIMPGNNMGGLPPPMPGSGGWITADNVNDYFDEEGNWKGDADSSLGAGAGSVRPREGGDGDDDGNGESAGGDGAGGDETKWRRTG